MEIKSYIPVRISFGYDCVKNNKDAFKGTGSFPLIVTGKAGAKKSGALQDVINVLSGGQYILYDRIEENPSLAVVEDASMMCKRYGCDYVIAIGGGSAIDAAKAIAVLAISDMQGMDLFSIKAEKALHKLQKVDEIGETKVEGEERARYYKDIIIPAMEALRKPIDELELIVDKELWPVPTYGEILFEI